MVLMARNKKRDYRVCGEISDMSIEHRSVRFIIAYNDSKREMGVNDYGFRTRTDYSLKKLAKIYISEIVKLHGVPLSIILDRDSRFTSKFWGKVHEVLDTKLNFSIAFHPQTDG
ncbi:integrase [Gossypium australe]|uniref:Integrase n=1 Tax=Gossypium australe TaxID=47621 RepID=A0A5B6X2E5_9ROSI|nr:integrase [Gossypium australe]